MAKQETTCDDILKELRAKQYRPVYYLMGEESYYIDLISDYIVDNVLTDTEKEFNLTVVYGADVDIGQVIGSIACITGFFGNIDSFTLTIPGIAGIILSIGMGVDANVITAERIKEELNNGKTLNGAIELGYKRAWSAVFDGNITVVFVAIILMGAFGPTDSVFGTLLSPVFSVFGASTAGTIYSLGYTLLVGILLNFVFGIFCSRLMLSSLSKFKCFKKRKLYGGAEINE